ncbi:MAG: hypothetical protein ACR2H0_07990 [Candidatus Limnocylindrales bacterium]
MREYVDIPGWLLPRRRWKYQAPPSVRVTDPMECPDCGLSISPQPVVYGYPDGELADAGARSTARRLAVHSVS